ncbi:Mur ligase family protein [Rhodanobacter sp. L36]|uniref:Mur ligase family protein n=1 Tax=Rhodanobacter sp. L36 TaxID=1747221 RepID=UPI00131BF846|nr:Mur ligase family protein [Rhodanobacter sp. L36]
MQIPLPFDDSRRLTGINLYFDAAGAVLETLGALPDDEVIDAWRARVESACRALHWPTPCIVAHRHASGASLAYTAPLDQLYSATEVNEWAWLAACLDVRASDVELHAPGHPAAWDEASAMHTLRAFARAEQRPDLMSLLQHAEENNLDALPDDDALTLGAGAGGRTWPMSALPADGEVPWSTLHDIPLALVTGSNGKTTTVRLLAAMARAHGWHAGHSCTDGVFIDGRAIDGGDFSGPAGARAVLRVPEVEAAILETARGGLLRRGLAVQRANVAVVTNVSDDHFGEYGVHDLDGLAQVKLLVARAIGADGLLVLNADDAMLVHHASKLDCPIGWFALDDANPLLHAHRQSGGATCGIRDGLLKLSRGDQVHDLGVVNDMPLSFGGSAGYNIANIAAASLAASALHIAPATIADVIAHFGGARADNPGRLQHWQLGSLQVFVDYAHNPEGVRGLLQVATTSIDGRLGLLLGQAGNREDAQIRELAASAASFSPALVVLKDIDGFMRGREPGEVARILRHELLLRGVRADAITECLDETAAVRNMLAWARAGDVLVLPTHGTAARALVSELLDDLEQGGWRPGTPFAITNLPH